MSHIYEVISCQQTSPTTMTFTLHNTTPDYPLAYQPGQYATISFMRHGRPTPARCFSITSSPTEQDILQFSIRVKGHYTKSAARYIKAGDKITVGGPFGGFIFNAERDKTSVFLAAGIGIAPFMSMIRYATRLGLPNEIVLLYGCQNQEDVPFAEELMYIEQINPHFHVVFAISQGSLTRFASHRAVNSRVTPELLYQVIGGAYTSHSFFICGPSTFMKSMMGTLQANHARKDRILSEAFSQAAQKHGSWMTWPSHIYAVTAASLLVGSGVTLAHDIATPKANIVVKGSNGSSDAKGVGRHEAQKIGQPQIVGVGGLFPVFRVNR
jgi:ferredoxin-NADP reductase